ncbi:MAG: hypothetical protein L0210_01020 [Rhodospirillales bacterium]|nr:hypothetical protein [Rhodospirillales bacterium]
MTRQAVKTPSWLAVALPLFVGVVLAGCREEEQDRVVFFEPGEYRGVSDEPLDAETVKALEQRTGNPQL